MFKPQGVDIEKFQISESNFKALSKELPKLSFETTSFEIVDELLAPKALVSQGLPPIQQIYMLLEFETPFLAHEGIVIIGSKLDTDIEATICRIAFSARVLHIFDAKEPKDLSFIKIVREKQRKGVIDRVIDHQNILISQMFTKYSDITAFIGKKVEIPVLKKRATIKGTFGQSGKIKAQLEGIAFNPNSEEEKKEFEEKVLNTEVFIRIEKYLFKK